MQVLSDLIPITDGEAFDIIRRNREQRNIKGLPHFHAQSMSATTGSSAHQHLAMTSRFAQRDAAREAGQKKANDVQIIQPSLLSGNQPHNMVPHTEIKLLHFLQKERDFYGPSSVVLRRFECDKDYQDSDDDEDEDDNTAGSSSSAKKQPAAPAPFDDRINEILSQMKVVSPTPLAIIAQLHQEALEAYQHQAFVNGTSAQLTSSVAIEAAAGAPPAAVAATPPVSDPSIPTLFHFESTTDNVLSLDHCLASLREHGQAKTRNVLKKFRDGALGGNALVKVMSEAWAEQTSEDKKSFGFGRNVNTTVIQRGVAKRLAMNSIKAAAASAAGNNTNANISSPASQQEQQEAEELQLLSSSGLSVPSTILRNLIDLRHCLTSAAHVAAVIPQEMDWIGDLAEFILRNEIVRESEVAFNAAVEEKAKNSFGNPAALSDDPFASTTATSKTSASGLPHRFHGVDDPSIVLPQGIVEGFRYSAVVGICRAVLAVLSDSK